MSRAANASAPMVAQNRAPGGDGSKPVVAVAEDADRGMQDLRAFAVRHQALQAMADASHRGQALQAMRRTMASQPGVVQCVVPYTASVTLDREGQVLESAASVKVQKLMLSEKARPPTKYGNRQAAHAVSWTLLMKSYQTFQQRSIAELIEHYLRPDWAGLRQQEGLKAGDEFKAYLKFYTDSYWDTLMTTQTSRLGWYSIVQTCLKDYFVALQLAPLSTHTGYAGHETNPSSHGEPAANKFFDHLEANNPKSAQESDVKKQAKAYLDVEVRRTCGIWSEATLKTVGAKFLKAFSRAYPRVWAEWQKAVTKECNAAVQRAVGNLVTEAADVDDSDEETEDEDGAATGQRPASGLRDNGRFQAMVELSSDTDAGSATAAYPNSAYKLGDIALSDARTTTKYGSDGQKSHTVAWTLVRRALQGLKAQNSLREFHREMLLKWHVLAGQDWAGMLKEKLIARKKTTSDRQSRAVKRVPRTDLQELENRRNRQRLVRLHELIAPNIKLLTDAMAGQKYSDGEWALLSNQTLVDYVQVYNSSPLATMKLGQAKGKGEPTVNKKFNTIEQEGGICKRGGEQIVTKGAKYLDISWRHFGPSSADYGLDKTPGRYASIAIDWEDGLRLGYPQIWSCHGKEFEARSDSIPLSKELQEEAKALKPDVKTLDSWTVSERSTRDYRRSMVAIHAGETPTSPSPQYAQVKGDYDNGVAAAQAAVGLDGEPTDSQPDAYQLAYREYCYGVADARSPLCMGLQRTSPAYTRGYWDYRTSVADVGFYASGPGTDSVGGQSLGKRFGLHDYQDGRIAFERRQGLPGPDSYYGFARGYAQAELAEQASAEDGMDALSGARFKQSPSKKIKLTLDRTDALAPDATLMDLRED